VASTRVALSWSPSSGSVAGYTVYRTVPPSARRARQQRSSSTRMPRRRPPIPMRSTPSTRERSLGAVGAPRRPTPAVSPEFVQGAAASPPEPSTSETLTLTQPLRPATCWSGGSASSARRARCRSRNSVNGPGRARSRRRGAGGRHRALLPAAFRPRAIGPRCITVSASAPAYLQEAARLSTRGSARPRRWYRKAREPTPPRVRPPRCRPASWSSRRPHRRPTRVRGRRSSQGVPYLIDAQNGSASSDLEDILSSAAGPQEGNLTLGSASNWVMVLATFQSTTGSTTTSTTDAADHHIDVHHHDHDPRTTTSTTTTRPPTTTTPTSHHHDHDPLDDDGHRTTHHDHRTADNDDDHHDDAAGDQHHVEVHDDHDAGADNDDDHQAVACVRRAVSPLPRKLSARAGRARATASWGRAPVSEGGRSAGRRRLIAAPGT